MKPRRKPVSVSSDLPKCPVGGCTRRRQKLHLTCSDHWKQVDPVKQKELLRLFKSAPGSSAHMEYASMIIRELGGNVL